MTGGPATPVSETEPCTRYVADEDHLDHGSNHVKWRAFRPRPADADLSIARIVGLSAAQTWQLGDEMAGRPSGRDVVGRADFTLPQVRAARFNGDSLDAISDPENERHALIVGWPADREVRKSLAQQLAAEALQEIR